MKQRDARALLSSIFAFALVLSGSACGSATNDENSTGPRSPDASSARVAHGTIQQWPEATAYLDVDPDPSGVIVEIGPARPGGLDALWSIATTNPASGYFYSDAVRGTSETRVAFASTFSRVSDIRDASKLAFTRASVGPVPVGGIVVIEHAASHRYLAIVLDAIQPTDPRTAGAGPYAYADVTWYLTDEGSADFGAP
ncbi:hypothetical protein AKJ09_02845 [Labilithrix luteola]|uniref:Lipoprotein n=1 Tax=Labilithrix luteola TaxID=1391654 RepID=A0A0K1PS24_9BACT|nr:hypothetical protein [Labilithrix luteola]AKU96181.1 hypothetical protein AKJ09_02845 [Labilithrix luteola]